MLAEKVVHHPTIIAGHCQGRGWQVDADSDVRSKFWGRSIELNPVGARPPATLLPTLVFLPGEPLHRQCHRCYWSSWAVVADTQARDSSSCLRTDLM